MMKYKVGDKVRVREGFPEGFFKEIEGKEFEIDRILEEDGLYYSILLENGDYWLLKEEMLEPIIDDTVKSIINNYKEDEPSFNFTISKYPKDSSDAIESAIIMLLSEMIQKNKEAKTVEDVKTVNYLIDKLKMQLELFKRRISDD